MKAIYTIFTCALAFVSYACNPNAKKLRLEPTDTERNAGTTDKIESRLLQSTTVLDTLIPNPGVKYRESRKINPQQPPVTLDFTGTLESKELDIARYFSTVRYLKLKYPYPDKGCFLSDANISFMYGEGGSFAYTYNSSVKFTAGNLVAGDPYMGYHCYDLSADHYVDYSYTPLDTIDCPFLTAFDIKGDTLCNFYNYNPQPVLKRSAATNPDRGAFYYYNDRFTVRQAYNCHVLYVSYTKAQLGKVLKHKNFPLFPLCGRRK